MGPQGLYLNRWDPKFDPAINVPKAVLVSVQLPNLPIHCWTTSSLQAIRKKLGTYIDKSHPKDNYCCACICVEVDLEAGLPEVIKLVIGEWHHFQKLDYEQLPFNVDTAMNTATSKKVVPGNPQKLKKILKKDGSRQKEQNLTPGRPLKKPRNPDL